MRALILLMPLALLTAQDRKIPVDNNLVRILSVTDQPAAKPGVLHEHKESRVMIYLDAGDIQVKYADGRVDNQHWKAGDVAWSPGGGMHTSQNISASPIRIIEIEVKAPGVHGAPPLPKLTGATPLFENDQVRVYRATKPAASRNFVAVGLRNAAVSWDSAPPASGPFVITEIKTESK